MKGAATGPRGAAVSRGPGAAGKVDDRGGVEAERERLGGDGLGTGCGMERGVPMRAGVGGGGPGGGVPAVGHEGVVELRGHTALAGDQWPAELGEAHGAGGAAGGVLKSGHGHPVSGNL